MPNPSTRGRSVLFWIIAVVITVAAAAYQRRIGPTRPVRGEVNLGQTELRYTLDRSHGGEEDHQVSIEVPDQEISGYLLFRRYKTGDPWFRRPLVYEEGRLHASIPHQPPAGKVIYRLNLYPDRTRDGDPVAVPPEGPVVLRYRGSVPAWVMIPHVLFIFLAMLWSNRAGIEALRSGADLRRLTQGALGLMVVGGLIFGPAVQWYAFGAAWTGFPLGSDLTDNKTLIATVAWIAAMIAVLRRGRGARWWVLGATIVTLGIFSIPHSVLGSELDYSSLPEAASTP